MIDGEIRKIGNAYTNNLVITRITVEVELLVTLGRKLMMC